jgi:DNA mismatch endonuclease, patch repair protein
MADIVSKETRSRIMSKVKGKNTRPEIRVRSLLHRLGYRFRLHDKHLPGKPDIIFTRRHAVIFVHGCFWHQHIGCTSAARPTTNTYYWNSKLDKNLLRDKENIKALKKIGWNILVLWECELKHLDRLKLSLTSFLGPAKYNHLS